MTMWDRLLLGAAPRLGHWGVRALARTLVLEVVDQHYVEPIWARNLPVIYAMWHGRILMLPCLYGSLRRPPARHPRTHAERAPTPLAWVPAPRGYPAPHPRVHVLASLHRDGELVARFVRSFGFEAVRGSSTRGGSGGLRHLARLLREGAEVAMIPDGPRGPRGVAQPGVIALARFTGCPIVPLSFSATRAWRLRSWDEFLIPKPFSKAVVCFGPPMTVPPAIDRSRQELLRGELEQSLGTLTQRADQLAQAV